MATSANDSSVSLPKCECGHSPDAHSAIRGDEDGSCVACNCEAFVERYVTHDEDFEP